MLTKLLTLPVPNCESGEVLYINARCVLARRKPIKYIG